MSDKCSNNGLTRMSDVLVKVSALIGDEQLSMYEIHRMMMLSKYRDLIRNNGLSNFAKNVILNKPSNKNFIELPSDYYNYIMVGQADECGKIMPLLINNDVDLGQYVEVKDENCDTKCDTCALPKYEIIKTEIEIPMCCYEIVLRFVLNKHYEFPLDFELVVNGDTYTYSNVQDIESLSSLLLNDLGDVTDFSVVLEPQRNCATLVTIKFNECDDRYSNGTATLSLVNNIEVVTSDETYILSSNEQSSYEYIDCPYGVSSYIFNPPYVSGFQFNTTTGDIQNINANTGTYNITVNHYCKDSCRNNLLEQVVHHITIEAVLEPNIDFLNGDSVLTENHPSPCVSALYQVYLVQGLVETPVTSIGGLVDITVELDTYIDTLDNTQCGDFTFLIKGTCDGGDTWIVGNQAVISIWQVQKMVRNELYKGYDTPDLGLIWKIQGGMPYDSSSVITAKFMLRDANTLATTCAWQNIPYSEMNIFDNAWVIGGGLAGTPTYTRVLISPTDCIYSMYNGQNDYDLIFELEDIYGNNLQWVIPYRSDSASWDWLDYTNGGNNANSHGLPIPSTGLAYGNDFYYNWRTKELVWNIKTNNYHFHMLGGGLEFADTLEIDFGIDGIIDHTKALAPNTTTVTPVSTYTKVINTQGWYRIRMIYKSASYINHRDFAIYIGCY